MSREGLISQLQTRGIQVIETWYGQQSVSAYRGTFQNLPAAIKVLSLAHGVDHTSLEKECRTLMSLSHPNILRLYDCFWENNGVSYFFVIVTEWCENDLAKDMRQRADSQIPWREDELWKLTFKLVSALAYMQEQGISHRDIKPESIFMTFTKETKLGDFGSARTFLSDTAFATLTGTPFYLSPKLREAFMRRNFRQVVHNSFKSDVHSLGLTLLSLIFLAPPMSLVKANLSNEEVQAVISTAPCSDLFKSMLTWMLSVDEEARCDFKVLNRWLEENDPTSREPGPPKATDGYSSQDLISSQTLPVSKPKGKLVCMQCENVVDLFGATAQCEVVQLYCQPSEHMFCSRECCYTFLSNGRFNCPKCGIEIPDETVGWCLRELSRRAVPKASEETQNLIEKTTPTGLSNPEIIEETKESAIASQIAEVPKQKSEPLCMQCGKTVDSYCTDAECQTVQLYCEPYQHMVCSRKCCNGDKHGGSFDVNESTCTLDNSYLEDQQLPEAGHWMSAEISSESQRQEIMKVAERTAIKLPTSKKCCSCW